MREWNTRYSFLCLFTLCINDIIRAFAALFIQTHWCMIKTSDLIHRP